MHALKSPGRRNLNEERGVAVAEPIEPLNPTAVTNTPMEAKFPAPFAVRQNQASANSIVLQWCHDHDVCNLGTSFEIERSVDGVAFSRFGSARDGICSVTVDAPSPGSSLWFRVRALAADGQRRSEFAQPITLSTPAAPPPTAEEQIMDARRREREDQAEHAAAHRRDVLKQYNVILLQQVLSEADKAYLNDVLSDRASGITDAQLQQDLQIIHTVRTKRADLAKTPPLAEGELGRLTANIKAAEEALKEAERGKLRAQARGGYHNTIKEDLKKQARLRPELFEPPVAGQLPRFIGEADAPGAV